jgi:hypothetical protein
VNRISSFVLNHDSLSGCGSLGVGPPEIQ